MKQLILILASVCSLSGCTLTGAIIGGVSDANAPDFDTLLTGQIKSLELEDDLLVVKKDNSTERGRFLVIDKEPGESYTQAYNTFLLQNTGATQLPRFGDSVFAIVSERPIGPFRFRGFDYDGTWLERPDSTSFPFHGSIVCNGQTFSSKAGLGDTPLMSSMIVSSGATRTRIPMESVKHVMVPHRQYELITGLLVGAVIDRLLIGAYASMW